MSGWEKHSANLINKAFFRQNHEEKKDAGFSQSISMRLFGSGII
jgi:hypothetical protein